MTEQPDLLKRPDHNTFYERYPRKKAPGRSEKAYDKATKLISCEELQEAVEAFRDLWDAHLKGLDTAARNAAKVFCPYPATWLNDKGWEDEEIQEQVAIKKAPPPEDIVFDATDKWRGPKQRLLAELGQTLYINWFKDMEIMQTDTSLMLLFPTRFIKDWVGKDYTNALERAFGGYVKFGVSPTPLPGDE